MGNLHNVVNGRLLPHGEEIWIGQDGTNNQGSVLWWVGIHGRGNSNLFLMHIKKLGT